MHPPPLPCPRHRYPTLPLPQTVAHRSATTPFKRLRPGLPPFHGCPALGADPASAPRLGSRQCSCVPSAETPWSPPFAKLALAQLNRDHPPQSQSPTAPHWLPSLRSWKSVLCVPTCALPLDPPHQLEGELREWQGVVGVTGRRSSSTLLQALMTTGMNE